MRKTKKLLSLVLIAALALSVVSSLAGCNQEKPNASTAPTGGESGGKGTYTVRVHTAGGRATGSKYGMAFARHPHSSSCGMFARIQPM